MLWPRLHLYGDPDMGSSHRRIWHYKSRLLACVTQNTTCLSRHSKIQDMSRYQNWSLQKADLPCAMISGHIREIYGCMNAINKSHREIATFFYDVNHARAAKDNTGYVVLMYRCPDLCNDLTRCVFAIFF